MLKTLILSLTFFLVVARCSEIDQKIAFTEGLQKELSVLHQVFTSQPIASELAEPKLQLTGNEKILADYLRSPTNISDESKLLEVAIAMSDGLSEQFSLVPLLWYFLQRSCNPSGEEFVKRGRIFSKSVLLQKSELKDFQFDLTEKLIDQCATYRLPMVVPVFTDTIDQKALSRLEKLPERFTTLGVTYLRIPFDFSAIPAAEERNVIRVVYERLDFIQEWQRNNPTGKLLLDLSAEKPLKRSVLRNTIQATYGSLIDVCAILSTSPIKDAIQKSMSECKARKITKDWHKIALRLFEFKSDPDNKDLMALASDADFLGSDFYHAWEELTAVIQQTRPSYLFEALNNLIYVVSSEKSQVNVWKRIHQTTRPLSFSTESMMPPFVLFMHKATTSLIKKVSLEKKEDLPDISYTLLKSYSVDKGDNVISIYTLSDN